MLEAGGPAPVTRWSRRGAASGPHTEKLASVSGVPMAIPLPGQPVSSGQGQLVQCPSPQAPAPHRLPRCQGQLWTGDRDLLLGRWEASPLKTVRLSRASVAF